MAFNLKAGGTRLSLATTLLSLIGLLYVIVLGTQFKMMSILGAHETADGTPGGRRGRHVSVDSLPSPSIERPARGKAAKLERGKAEKRRTLAPKETYPRRLSTPKNAIDWSAPTPAERRQYTALSSSIAGKWNLTTPNAVELLERQFAKVNDYDSEKDFFHFHHLYKSGGTSISNLLDQTVGLPRLGDGRYEGILPGSYESGNFDHDEALNDVRRRRAAGTRREDLPYRASYAHTGLRPVYGPRRTRTGAFLLDNLPRGRRLRAIAMLRDPTDFRASNHAMIMCGLNYEVGRWNGEREAVGLARVCAPQDGLNVSEMVDRKIEALLVKCQTKPDLPGAMKRQCKKEKQGIDTLTHCRSARHLLNSPQYDKHYRSMFKPVMGRFHRGQWFTNSTVYGRMGYGFERAEESSGYSREKVEEYTLEDLGGLDAIRVRNDLPPEPDFLWFGITERMAESTALFYFHFKSAPLRRTPTHRIQSCSPRSWWTREDRETVMEREPADYAVWRAANAILDVRVEKMKREIQTLLDAGATREQLFYVDWEQLEGIGVKFRESAIVDK